MLDVLYMLDLLNATHAMLCMFELLSALSHACFTPSPLCFFEVFFRAATSEQRKEAEHLPRRAADLISGLLLADRQGSRAY